MAEHPSRTGSRGTTPQPVASTLDKARAPSTQRHSARVTRSVSRDISDSEARRKATKVKKRAKQVEAAGQGTKVKKGKTLQSSVQEDELSMIVESPGAGSADLHSVNPKIELDNGNPSERSNETLVTGEGRPKKKSTKGAVRLSTFEFASPESRRAAQYLQEKIKGQTAKEKKPPHPLESSTTPGEFHVPPTAAASIRAKSPHRQTENVEISASSASAAASTNQEAEYVDDSYLPHQTDDLVDEESNDEDAFEATNPITKRIVERTMEITTQQQAESNKENEVQRNILQPEGQRRPRLIDPQPNARQIQFDSQDGDSGDQQGAEFDVSEDEGYQQASVRGTGPSRNVGRVSPKRPAQSSQTSRPSPLKRSRIQEPPRQSVDRATPAGRALQERPTQTTVSSTYNHVNAKAKERQVIRPKRPQARKPWSEEENGRLIGLIVAEGISYARLKKIDANNGDILAARDQVALKDKARNMKMDYLRAGKFMPMNFELIPLSRQFIQRLEDMGIEYDERTGHLVDGEWLEGQGPDVDD